MPARRKTKSTARSKPKSKSKSKSLASKASRAVTQTTHKARAGAAKFQRGAKKVVSKVGRAAEVTRDVAGTVANVADALLEKGEKSDRGSRRGTKKPRN